MNNEHHISVEITNLLFNTQLFSTQVRLLDKLWASATVKVQLYWDLPSLTRSNLNQKLTCLPKEFQNSMEHLSRSARTRVVDYWFVFLISIGCVHIYVLIFQQTNTKDIAGQSARPRGDYLSEKNYLGKLVISMLFNGRATQKLRLKCVSVANSECKKHKQQRKIFLDSITGHLIKPDICICIVDKTEGPISNTYVHHQCHHCQ